MRYTGQAGREHTPRVASMLARSERQEGKPVERKSEDITVHRNIMSFLSTGLGYSASFVIFSIAELADSFFVPVHVM